MTKLTRKVPPNEEGLRKTDKWLEGKMAKLNEEQKSSVLMAGNELLENAVKFHMEKKLSANVLLQVNFSETVEIRVTNQFENHEEIAGLLRNIDEINSGGDPRLQYMYRLKDIMERRVPGESRLGLLRIAGEGNFDIQYEIMDNKLTVRASKYINRKRENTMESLITEEFAVNVKDNDPVIIHWTGRSRDLNPSALLDRYLEELITNLLDKDVVVDFTEMDSLNSSTIPPILSFLTGLEKKRIRTTVRYAGDVYWQKASFKPLSVLTRDFQFVTIQPV